MRKLTIVALSALTLGAAGCSTVERDTGTGALLGAGAGALIGQVAGGDTRSTVTGAAIGGLGGAIAGNLVGRSSASSGDCIYSDSAGRRYVSRCPSGY
jgi:uncharacterized protein YcfJ